MVGGVNMVSDRCGIGSGGGGIVIWDWGYGLGLVWGMVCDWRGGGCELVVIGLGYGL